MNHIIIIEIIYNHRDGSMKNKSSTDEKRKHRGGSKLSLASNRGAQRRLHSTSP